MNDPFKLAVIAAIVVTGIVTVILWDQITGPHNGAVATVPVVLPKLSADEQRGEQLYTHHCAECHGPKALGSPQGPPFLHRVYHPDHHADGAFFLAVRNGVRRHHWPFGDMPPQPNITDSQVSLILAYVRALQRANGYAPPH